MKIEFTMPIHVLTEDWAEEKSGSSSVTTELFSDLDSARRAFADKLASETQDGGLLCEWRDRGFVEEHSEDSYECYEEGSYSSNHYRLFLTANNCVFTHRFVEESVAQLTKSIENERI